LVAATTASLWLALLACSPEARRVRDGGPGADPGNKRLVVREEPVPHAADTTLWPGRAPAPVDLLARGIVPPATYPVAARVPPAQGEAPIKPRVPPSAPQQRTFDSGSTADPRRRTNKR
jgi:hypothetical protein